MIPSVDVPVRHEDERRRAALQSWLDRDVRVRFADRLLIFDDRVAERWGQLEAVAKRQRVTLPTVDAQLAATALHSGLTFATLNTVEVRPTGVPVSTPGPTTRRRSATTGVRAPGRAHSARQVGARPRRGRSRLRSATRSTS